MNLKMDGRPFSKKIRRTTYVEKSNPLSVADKLVYKSCESVADALISHIDCDKEYIIKATLKADDWNEGIAIKYTYEIDFGEVVRCADCKLWEKGNCEWNPFYDDPEYDMPYGFCAWGARKENHESKTLGNKTCRNISNPPEGFRCSKCGWGDFAEPTHLLTSSKYSARVHGGPNYCPNCGAKVVDE